MPLDPLRESSPIAWLTSPVVHFALGAVCLVAFSGLMVMELNANDTPTRVIVVLAALILVSLINMWNAYRRIESRSS